VAAGSSQASGFIVSRSTPAAPAAPVLASVQQLDEQVETRGLCEGALRRLRADCARQCRQRPEIWRVLAQRLSVMGACDPTNLQPAGPLGCHRATSYSRLRVRPSLVFKPGGAASVRAPPPGPHLKLFQDGVHNSPALAPSEPKPAGYVSCALHSPEVDSLSARHFGFACQSPTQCDVGLGSSAGLRRSSCVSNCSAAYLRHEVPN
jgi:hypothetical protein